MPIKSLFLFLWIFVSRQSSTAQYTSQKKDKTKYFYISVRPGISLDHMRVKGYFKEPVKFNNPGNLYIAGAFDVDYGGEVIFRTEVAYKPMRFHAEGGSHEYNTFNTYDLKGFSFTSEFQLFLKKALNPNLNIYGGAGFGYKLSKIFTNEITYVGIPPRDAAHSLNIEPNDGVVSFATGLIYNDHFEINCKLSLTQWGISSANKLTHRFINIGVCYRL